MSFFFTNSRLYYWLLVYCTRSRIGKVCVYLKRGDPCSVLLSLSLGRCLCIVCKRPEPCSHGVSTTSGSVSSVVTASLTATAVVGVMVELISWSHGVVVSLHAEYMARAATHRHTLSSLSHPPTPTAQLLTSADHRSFTTTCQLTHVHRAPLSVN